jgi:hypothetical protein
VSSNTRSISIATRSIGPNKARTRVEADRSGLSASPASTTPPRRHGVGCFNIFPDARGQDNLDTTNAKLRMLLKPKASNACGAFGSAQTLLRLLAKSVFNLNSSAAIDKLSKLARVLLVLASSICLPTRDCPSDPTRASSQ